MAGVPNVKTFTASPWSDSLNVVYGFPRRDVRLLTCAAVPVTVTLFWSKAAGFLAISATVAALAHRAGLASASTQISASVRVARREPIMVPMDTILPIEQRPDTRSPRLDRHHVQLGGFLLAMRAGDRLRDRLPYVDRGQVPDAVHAQPRGGQRRPPDRESRAAGGGRRPRRGRPRRQLGHYDRQDALIGGKARVGAPQALERCRRALRRA